MKKLMVALSAVALAMGVHAAGAFIEGENFNDAQTVPATITDAGGECAISPVPYTFGKESTIGAPDQYRLIDALSNLTVKTALTTPAYWTPAAAATPLSMSGLYFDSLVKFTACDEDAVVPEGSNAKLMVWVKESETGDATNLMVTAGFLSDELNTPIAKIYDCGALSSYDVAGADDWCRLTIKAKADISNGDIVPGFVVFVNGKRVTIANEPEGNRDIGVAESAVSNLNRVDEIWHGNNQLFPSMIATVQTVTSVGFAGQGAVDDLAFTTLEPTDQSENEFALDPTPATVGLVIDGVEQPGVTTIAQAITAIGNISSPVDTVELTLFEGYNGAINFAANENVGQLVLDLAGQTITVGDTPEEAEDLVVAVSSAIPMLITDSSTEQTGKIVAGEGSLAVSATAALEIDAGTFDGTVYPQGTGSISGGVFAGEEGEFYLFDYLAAGKTATYAEGYWTVADAPKKGWAIYLAAGDEANEFLISKEDDLLALATNCNKDADFATAGIKFTQTANIALTAAFPGIGAQNAKDAVASNRDGYKAGAFQGTYDGGNFTITGLQLPKKNAAGECSDYLGLFNCLYNATIKNVSVGITGTGWTGDTPTKEEWSGAVIAGVAVDATLENCSTIAGGTFTTKKAAAGIVGFATGGTTLKGCTNNLAITSDANEKVAGLIACVQKKGDNDNADVLVEDCANYGNITGPNNKQRIAGLVSYTDDCCVTFKGDITCGGTLTGGDVQSVINLNDGSAAVAAGAVIKVPAGYKTTIHNSKAHAGLNYATVDGSVATLVADNALTVDGSYKVMTTGNAPVIVLGAGEQITFDQTLATINAAGITTSATGYEVTQEGNTYKATPKSYGITYTWTGVDAGDVSKIVNSNPTTYTFGTGVASFADASCEGYTFKGWNPTSIAANATEAQTITGTFEKQSTWPAEWPDADPAVQEKFATWKSTYGVTDFTGKEAAFLLNVAPGDEKPLVIEEINVIEGEAAIVVSADDVDLSKINGVAFVEAGDTLEEMAPKAFTDWVSKDGKMHGRIAAKFVKAVIGFKAPAE